MNYQRRKADGFTVVGIRVEGTAKRAWLERTAYEALIEAHGCRPWFVRGTRKAREVVFESRCPGIYLSVAGALTGAEVDERVIAKDGDYLNLRTGNLTRQ